MKNRPPPPAGLKNLEKTVVLKDSPQARSKAPVAPVPPAKGAPVAPPPMWNYDGKAKDDAEAPKPSADAPKSPAGQGEASTRGATGEPVTESTAPASGLTKEQEAEDLAAIIDTNKAMAELYEQVDLLEALVAQLPK